MEVAGGLIAAEQIVSTTIEGGAAAGYAISRPTLPLKASFSCIGSAEGQGESSGSLARSSHTVNTINGDLYIFGGIITPTKLASNDLHILKLSNVSAGNLGSQYHAVPAIARDGDDIPSLRAGHTAVVIDGKIVVFGGFNDVENPRSIEEAGRVWLFDPVSFHWSHLDVANERYPKRYYHAAAAHGRNLVIHGGYEGSSDEAPKLDAWTFNLDSRTWSELPALPTEVEGKAPILASAPPSIAVADDTLYLVAGSTDLGSQIFMLDLALDPSTEENHRSWTSLEFPTNPLTPGPRPRKGAGLVPIKTGLGRTYLLLMLGEKEDGGTTLEKSTSGTSTKSGEEASFWSGLWVLQCPSREKTPAQLKDKVRDQIPSMDSHEAEWSEVELVVDENESSVGSGRSHPGPRGYFGCDVLSGSSVQEQYKGQAKVCLWGGINPRGEREGDGWVVDLKV